MSPKTFSDKKKNNQNAPPPWMFQNVYQKAIRDRKIMFSTEQISDGPLNQNIIFLSKKKTTQQKV